LEIFAYIPVRFTPQLALYTYI